MVPGTLEKCSQCTLQTIQSSCNAVIVYMGKTYRLIKPKLQNAFKNFYNYLREREKEVQSYAIEFAKAQYKNTCDFIEKYGDQIQLISFLASAIIGPASFVVCSAAGYLATNPKEMSRETRLSKGFFGIATIVMAIFINIIPSCICGYRAGIEFSYYWYSKDLP